MKFLLILCLAGLSSALQPKLTYRYEYVGTAETGIPELSTVGSAAGIKANIDLEVHENGHVIIQLHDTEFGEHDGCLGCDWKKGILDHFKPHPDKSVTEMIERPFKANLFSKEDYAYIIEEEDILWVRNIRRAIANLFRNKLNKANFEINESCSFIKHVRETGKVPRVFTTKESTTMGKCEVHYTVHPMSPLLVDSDQYKLHTEVDVQLDDVLGKLTGGKGKGKTSRKSTSKGRKTTKSSKYRRNSVPELHDQLYHVTREINFDNCDELVYGQHTSGTINFVLGHAQHEWLGGRSSVSEFTFRGKGGAFRMESAIHEGAFTSNALGSTKEIMHARTYQILNLRRVTESTGSTVVSDSGVHVHGWLQEIYSPLPTPTIAPVVSWITYNDNLNVYDPVELLTGIKKSEKENESRKKFIISCIEGSAKSLVSTKPESNQAEVGLAIRDLKFATYMVEGLSISQTKEIVDHFMNDVSSDKPEDIMKRKLVVDVLVASGTKASAHLVLDLIKSNKLTDVQILFISATFMQTLTDITIINDLADYVMSIDLSEKPILGSTVLMNFANLVNHYCVKHDASEKNYAGFFYGDLTCDAPYLHEHFLKPLTDIIYDESKNWERLVAIKVLGKLGVSQTVSILEPVILGKKGTCDTLRVTAIYSINRWVLPSEVRDHAMRVLTQVYTNVAEMPRVRIAAMIMVSSFGPEPSFWYRLARHSWREPSVVVASFSRSLIHAFAHAEHYVYRKQNQAAKQAMRFIRPVVPSIGIPHFEREITKGMKEHYTRIHEIGYVYFPYPEVNINRDVYVFDMMELNGASMISLEGLFSQSAMGSFIEKTFMEVPESESSNIVAKLFKDINDDTKAEPTSGRRNVMISFYVRLFQNMNFLIPYQKQVDGAFPFPKKEVANFLGKLASGTDIVFGKFFTLASTRCLLSNEMGLPVTLVHAGHMAVGNNIFARLSMSQTTGAHPENRNLPNKVHLFSKSYSRFASTMSGDLSVIIPWTTSMIQTNVESHRETTEPLLMSFDLERKEDGTPLVALSSKPGFDKEYSFIRAKTVPTTKSISLHMTNRFAKYASKTLTTHKNFVKDVELPNKYTGLDYKIHWESQIRYPFDKIGVMDLFKRVVKQHDLPPLVFLLSSSTAQYWSFDMKFDPISSQTKNVILTMSLEKAVKEKKKDDISQFTQETGDFDYGQEEFSQYGQDALESEDFGASVDSEHLNIHDNHQKKSEKMEKHFGAKANSLSVKVDFNGEESRSYEFFYSWAKPAYANNRRKLKSQLALIRGPVPHVDDQSLSVCVDFTAVTPIISAMDTFPEVLDKNLDTEIVRTVTPNCHGDPVLKTESVLKLSPKRIERLREEIPKSCFYEEYDALNTFKGLAMYDDNHMRITWESVCDKSRMPMLTAGLSFVEKVMKWSFDKCDNKHTSNMIDIYTKRCTETDSWYVTVKADSDEMTTEAVPRNEFFDFMSRINTYTAHSAKSMLRMWPYKSNKCVLSTSKVRTFDDAKYSYEPSQCWSVAAKDCAHDTWVVLVRSPKTELSVPEVRILDKEHLIAIDHLHDHPADEKKSEYHDKEGNLIAKIWRAGEHVKIKMVGKFSVTIKDTVHVQIYDDSFEVCGMCGDRNEEKEAEFLGPKHCLYSDAQTFVNSWTTQIDSCDTYEFHEKRKAVDKHQATCHPIYDMYSHVANYSQEPIVYSFVTVDHQDHKCISFYTIPKCDHHHVVDDHKHIKAHFNCYTKEAYTKVEESKRNSKVTSPVYLSQPDFKTVLPVTADISCL